MFRRRSSSRYSRASKRKNIFLGFDEFGFAIYRKKSHESKMQHRCHEYSYPKMDIQTLNRLEELLRNWDQSNYVCRNKLIPFIHAGVPANLRGCVWKCLLGTDTLQESSDFSYQECLREIRMALVDLGVSEYGISSAIITLTEAENGIDSSSGKSCSSSVTGISPEDIITYRQIALDLQRSFPSHRSLMGNNSEAIEGQAKLFRVLLAYAKYNTRTGYSQGMSYIAAVLLMNLPEEDAFWTLVALLDGPNYLAGLFDQSLLKIQHNAKIFQELLKHKLPQLYQHIDSLGVTALHFVTPWFLTLFTSLPCWDTVLAIWDLIMLKGISAVFSAGLCIMQLLESRLLEMSDLILLPTLLRVPVDVCKYCIFVPVLWKNEIYQWEIDCMESLVLEEEAAQCLEERKRKKTPHKLSQFFKEKKQTFLPVSQPKESEQSTNRAPDGFSKTIFSKLLRAAQRYLGDPTPATESRQKKMTTPHRGFLVRNYSRRRSSTSSSKGQMWVRKNRQNSFKESKCKASTQGLAATESETSAVVSVGNTVEECNKGSDVEKRMTRGSKRLNVKRCPSQSGLTKLQKSYRNKELLSPLKAYQTNQASLKVVADASESNLKSAKN
ncbi:TB10C protein, partial [Polypterus senegalus]|nr:TB10C protein [Polypterus senegalus]